MMRTLAKVLHGFADGSQAAVRSLLETVGERPNREGLLDTPRRVVEAWKEFLSHTDQELEDLVKKAVFDLEKGEGEHPGIVALQDISFACISRETLLPFYGKCHVVYKIADNKILGLSKVARFVHAASRKIQTQEEFTKSIAGVMRKVTNSPNVAVFTTAVHIYYDRPLRTVHSSSLSGSFKNSPTDAQELLFVLPIEAHQQTSEISPEDKAFNIVPNAVVSDELHDHLQSLFRGLSVTPDPEAIIHYGYQLYCSTAGLRSCPSFPYNVVEMLPDDNGSVNGQGGHLAGCVADFVSLCEHHLLPFHGKIFVGCTTDRPTLSSSDVSRVVAPYLLSVSHQPQVQERLTNQIADHVKRQLSVSSVLVLCEAMHLCMIGRGPQTHQTATRTMCKRGDVSLDILHRGNVALRRHYEKTV